MFTIKNTQRISSNCFVGLQMCLALDCICAIVFIWIQVQRCISAHDLGGEILMNLSADDKCEEKRASFGET